MNENEKPSPQSRIENLTKKLETPRITLLQTKGLVLELQEIIRDINREFGEKYQKGQKPNEEEVEAINKLISEFNRKSDEKVFSFVDKWETKDFTPNNQEVEYLQSVLTNIWQSKGNLRLRKEHEAYEKDKKFTEQTDKIEQDIKPAIPYHNKLLFLISQHYNKDQQNTSSTSSDQKKKKDSTVLPWTLAIIFGITTVILACVAGFLFYKQRKIKRFKVSKANT
jgi:hypothetical protein